MIYLEFALCFVSFYVTQVWQWEKSYVCWLLAAPAPLESCTRMKEGSKRAIRFSTSNAWKWLRLKLVDFFDPLKDILRYPVALTIGLRPDWLWKGDPMVVKGFYCVPRMLRIFFKQRVFLLATWQLILASVVGGRGNIGTHAFRFPDKVACLQRQNLDASGRVMLAQSWMGTSVLKKINVQVFSQFWALLSHSLTKDSFEDIFDTWATNLLQAFSNLLGRPEVRLYWFLAVPLCCMLGALFHGNRHVHCSCLWRGRPRKGDVALLIGCFQVIAWMNGDSVPRFWPMTYWKMNTKSFVRFRTLPSTHPAASKIFKFMVLMNVCKPSTIIRLPDYQSQFSWIFDFHGAHKFLWCEIQAGESGSGAFRILCLDTKSTWPVHLAATKWFVGVEVCRVRGDNIEISKGCRNTMNTGIWRLYHHKTIVSFQFLVTCDHFILDEAEDHVKRAVKL